MTIAVRRVQCRACPWKKSTVPDRDIPGGYCATKHANLDRTIARDGDLPRETLRLMACHETEMGRDLACTGWVEHQLGPGNNIALRLAMLGQRLDLELDGPQHQTFEATLPKKRKRARR